MTGGLRARHSGESALSCKLHTVRCTTSSYYCEMQCKAPSFCRREKREWLGFNLSRVRQREGHNLPYTHTLCKMFNKVCTMVTVCGRDTTYDTHWGRCAKCSTNLHKFSLHNGHSMWQGHHLFQSGRCANWNNSNLCTLHTVQYMSCVVRCIL